jgi:hypothetical protein
MILEGDHVRHAAYRPISVRWRKIGGRPIHTNR